MWIGFVVIGALVASVAIAMILAYSCYLCDLIRHHSRLTSINDDEKLLMGSINRSTYKQQRFYLYIFNDFLVRICCFNFVMENFFEFY